MATKVRSDQRATPPNDATPSIIAAGVKLTGDISATGEIHLDGQIIGNLTCTGLTMGEGSRVEGSIQTTTAVIRGAIDGKLSADDVRIEKTAELDGDVYHKTLSVEAGARITGRFIHGEKPDSAATAAADVEPIKGKTPKLEAAE